ncbi:hypothetical protein [Patulibacter sp.]|uniref:hypothetical protein n=1 Tax=Patulibacter sp. TaxID=1912859 RepID=UPI0027260669|nr:hypothetical protein [Patulibacter sp.]MDO9409956.1 hypothetical protein [Patulibacter sp.]
MSFLRIFRLPRPDLAELRRVVDDLPVHVRIAMLEGVRHERLIAGAYTDDGDGVCPMLAAHRHGARWSHPDFARTWDEFAEAPIEGFRAAKPRHVEALEGALRASIETELRTPEPEPQVEVAERPETSRSIPTPAGDADEVAPRRTAGAVAHR